MPSDSAKSSRRLTLRALARAVFWDIENTTIPARGLFSSGAAIVRRMRQVFLRYGQIKTIRAYTDMTRLNVDARGGLQSSGVHLIDVPTRRKDAADKMILADLLLWCVDNQPPSTVVLVSGDRDFSYALAKLAQRQYVRGRGERCGGVGGRGAPLAAR